MVAAGTTINGVVQKLDHSVIATRFATVGLLPIIPLSSIYFVGVVRSTSKGIPFIAGTTREEYVAWPCARLNWESVICGYLWGLARALVIVGAILLLFSGFARLSDWGRAPPEHARQMELGVMGAIGVGAVVGLFTYLLPRRVAPKDRAIRDTCAAVFGVGADPAKVDGDTAVSLCLKIDDALTAEGVLETALTDPVSVAKDRPRVACLLLLRSRAMEAIEPGNTRYRQWSSELLPLVIAHRQQSIDQSVGTAAQASSGT